MIKKQKKEIVYRFCFALVSRNIPSGYFHAMGADETTNNCEHWYLCLENSDIWFGSENLFEAVNCKHCGNYKMEADVENAFPKRIMCEC